MRQCRLSNYFRNHFSARIFLTFSMLVIVVSISFTAFFFHYESESLTEHTIDKGKLLATLFGQTAKLGVFSENVGQLTESMDAVLQNEEVLSVAVFDVEGKVLAIKQKPGNEGVLESAISRSVIARMAGEPVSSTHRVQDGTFAFLNKLTLPAQAPGDDDLYSDPHSSRKQDLVIGFVGLVLDGKALQQSLHALLFHSVLIGVAFLVIGSIVAFFIARKVTRPLKNLTREVNAFGMGGGYREVVIETADEVGNLATAFNVMADSLQKREAEKQELAEQLRHSQKMEAVGTLAGGVAHDFNNILSIVRAYADLLRRSLKEGEQVRSYADQIDFAVEKAKSLTQRLLAFSRKQVVHRKQVKLNTLVNTLRKIILLLLTEDITVDFDLSHDDPAVMADPGQLDHVLVNIVTNARDAMPGGGKLIVRTAVVSRGEHGEDRKYAMVSVTDTGVGMTEEISQRIFDPFYTTKEVGKGTGLGLSMAYGIVKQHDGLIEVVSEPGAGTTVSILLPLVGHVAEPRPEHPVRIANGNGETILFAEDNADVMTVMKKMLEDSGYRVIAAFDGEDALLKFRENSESIDMAILDVIMPRKNGKQVHDEIIRIKPHMAVLFMSGYTSDVLDYKAQLDGSVELIQKPVMISDLLVKMRELLDSNRRLDYSASA